MNEFLAELYGTREVIGAEDTSDVEKLAEAQILDNVLKSEGIDVDQLEDDTILKMAHEIFGDDSEIVKSAMSQEVTEEGTEKNAEEADLMGRIMAHSYTQELNEIEKTAGRKLERTLGSAQVGGLKGLAAGGLGGSVLGAGIGALKGGKAGALKGALFGGLGGGYAGMGAGQIAGGVKGYKAGKKDEKAIEELAKLKGKKKAASAVDTLAEQRAMEILKEAGIEPKGTEDTKLASAIESRAYEMLTEAGYISE